MPVNFVEIQSQIHQLGGKFTEQEQRLHDKQLLAAQTLTAWSDRLDELAERVEQAKRATEKLRCAVPLDEPLGFHTGCPETPEHYLLLAADGSQINPDRHAQVEFAVINVGAIRLHPGSLDAPQELTQSVLLYGDDLYTASGPVTEEVVALRRDLAERRLLAETAAYECKTTGCPPILTLTDGPLELFREPKPSSQYDQLFEQYLQALDRLSELQVAAAGYVDKPRSDLLVRLLELTLLKDEELAQAGRKRPLERLTDAALLRDLLQPGERSAIFAIQSSSSERFTGALALHFFYINLGRPQHPWLARVELPAWVARSAPLRELVHAGLVQQAGQMGAKPYPYALHRAHEIAVVSMDEKTQVTNMLVTEMLNRGIQPGEQSYKQNAKATVGSRTRYNTP